MKICNFHIILHPKQVHQEDRSETQEDESIFPIHKTRIRWSEIESVKLKKNSRNFRLNREMRKKFVVYDIFFDEF